MHTTTEEHTDQPTVALAEAHDGSSLLTAIVAQNLAMTFKYTGRFDDADRLYRRALELAERLGERRLVAVVCHNLGGLEHARGDYAAGIPWARRSVREREPLDDPVGLATDRGALAVLRPAVEPQHPLLRTIEDNLATATGRTDR